MSRDRIRVRASGRKAWVGYDRGWSISQLRLAIAEQMGARADCELQLQGFALLDRSTCDIIDSSRDVLDLKTAQASTAPSTSRKRLRLVVQDAATDQHGQSPAKPLTGPARALNGSSSSSSSSSSSASSTSSASSSDSSETPSSSDSGGSSSDVDVTIARSESLQSSSPSDSSDSSPSRASDALARAKRTAIASLASLDASARDSGPAEGPKIPRENGQVPPGQGKAKTRARNARKKKKLQHDRLITGSLQVHSGSPLPMTAPTTCAAIGKTLPVLFHAHPWLPPSLRDDLPPHISVVSLDVEARDFVPGQLQPDFVPQLAPTKHKRESVASNGHTEAPLAEIEQLYAQMMPIEPHLLEQGMRIAVKNVELDAESCMPIDILYAGTVAWVERKVAARQDLIPTSAGQATAYATETKFGLRLGDATLSRLAASFGVESAEQIDEEGELSGKVRFGQDALASRATQSIRELLDIDEADVKTFDCDLILSGRLLP
ncbi:uncharacterized protein L969DRAFT_96041 [Mixia osmundae IAM 14324]|uniref:Uncharacterized protein n=1 Tax=Mixia osmundae (strain CBS 9802 / IAM 14324 / JCM 22182 / KY 12970) TaxID=764103 RepID=G7DS75_MIXOS|nr:uncharacterized protein L969DRAFT_96041 [Mixia osmundae IAM 14324]KEI37512.1 hypothetical protein L969DRAFT_96041 [Mixia osmundae IAM 14324]GAA93435.1 hypothetical protein E5Q_00076 [Mixia osmundae IAM 14324]